MYSFEEVLQETIDEMEGQGVDFKEEVGIIELCIDSRPDLLITIQIVDRAVEDSFREYDDLIGRLQ